MSLDREYDLRIKREKWLVRMLESSEWREFSNVEMSLGSLMRDAAVEIFGREDAEDQSKQLLSQMARSVNRSLLFKLADLDIKIFEGWRG